MSSDMYLVLRSQTQPTKEGSGDKPTYTLFKYHRMLDVKLLNRYVKSTPFIQSTCVLSVSVMLVEVQRRLKD